MVAGECGCVNVRHGNLSSVQCSKVVTILVVALQKQNPKLGQKNTRL